LNLRSENFPREEFLAESGGIDGRGGGFNLGGVAAESLDFFLFLYFMLKAFL